MSESLNIFSRLAGPVTDYFVIESHVTSTRTADAYKALDKLKRQSVGLWITRQPLRPDVEEAFASRLQRLASVSGIGDILSCGVDSDGTGFIVSPVFDGQPLTFGEPESAELERRFLSCLRVVERIHAAGVVCGDLCLESFLLGRGGQVQFIGVAGSFEETDGIMTETPSIDELAYMPTEQQSAGAVSTRVDVYALGTLAYRLFTGALPALNRDPFIPISEAAPQVPSWVDGVLPRALNMLPNQRFPDAALFLSELNAQKAKIAQEALAPAVIEKPQSVRHKNTALVAVQIPGRQAPGSADREEDRRAGREASKGNTAVPKVRPTVVAGAIGIVVFAGVTLLLLRPTETTIQPVNIEPSDIAGLTGAGRGESTLEYIARLGSSDDPLAHHALLIVAKEQSQFPEIVDAVYRTVLDRARRLGLARSSDQLRAWLKADGVNVDVEQREPLFKLMDPALPTPSRVEILKAEYYRLPRLVLRLTASFVLDLKEYSGFRAILVPAATDVAHAPDAEERSTLAILLLFADLSSIFLEDILASSDRIPDADVTWLLRDLAKQGAPQLPAVADLALSRKMTSGARQIFMQMIRKRTNLDKSIVLALVEGALGVLSSREVALFGTWYDEQAERVLAACIVVAEDPDTSLAALDALAAKPIMDPFVASLVESVQGRFRPDRRALVKLVGAVALLDVVSPEYFKSAFDGLDKLSNPKDLLFMLLKSPAPEVVGEVMSRYAGLFDMLSLIDLLPHENKAVRLAAVRNLKDANDIGMLKLLLDAYDREADPDVRKAYEDNVSIVKERVSARR
jgi:hypothetical protein